MEKSDNGSFKLGTFSSVDGSGRESFPNDRLADVGCNKQRNTEMGVQVKYFHVDDQVKING